MVSEKFIAFAEDGLSKARQNPNVSTIDSVLGIARLCTNEFQDFKYALQITSELKSMIIDLVGMEKNYDFNHKTFYEFDDFARSHGGRPEELHEYWKIMQFEAEFWLDSYCLFIEKERPIKERFYQPRRKTLIKVVNVLQQLEDDELDELFVHMPARVGKSQIITMATAWHCARHEEYSNLYVTYKEGLGGAFLDGVMEIWTDPMYCHNDVFQSIIARTDAKNHKVDLGRKKKYASLSGKGLESGLNGEYDCYGWLIIDDILEGIQDVLNPDILHRKQIVFDNNVMKRKKEKCKVIYNGTIWSLHDIYMDRLNFLENNPEAKGIRYAVLKIPALDPETDESNFARSIR